MYCQSVCAPSHHARVRDLSTARQHVWDRVFPRHSSVQRFDAFRRLKTVFFRFDWDHPLKFPAEICEPICGPRGFEVVTMRHS